MRIADKETASKILREVPSNNAFYFFTSIGQYTGEYAISLEDFCRKIRKIDLKSIEFHYWREDFEKWIRTTVGDAYLADKIKEIGKTLEGDQLRSAICQTLEERIAELKKTLTTKSVMPKRSRKSIELADETHIKRCSFCGNKINTPTLYKGYVFCSTKCKDSFISSREKPKPKTAI